MIFYYIRHGDPTYDPDMLTPLGMRQAEAVAKRLSLYGLDEVYSSTSNRAIMTAKPTCEILKKEPILLDFANEAHTWREFTLKRADGTPYTWLSGHTESRALLSSKEVRDLGDRWFENPAFAGQNYDKAVERIYNESDAFFSSLGYEHDRFTGKYKVIKANNKRIALFAHHGFGMAFLSCLLDIPYPAFCTHFDMCHTGMTVIEFKDENGYAIPNIVTMASDSHIYREGLPTQYRGFYF